MRSSVASLAAACWLLAACSRPVVVQLNVRSPPPEEHKPTPSPDAWTVAAGWHVPTGPIGDAQRFLLRIPAYQYTSDGEDLDTHQKSHAEACVVHNGGAFTDSTGTYGRNSIITDGKREFVFFRGRYGEEPGDAAATLADQIKGTSLQALLDGCEEHTPFLGTEKINGVEVELYALNASWERIGRGMAPSWAVEGGHLWVWIAKDDHRPLKVEWKENRRDRQRPNVTHASILTRTYRYDPNIKVTFPN